jgi:hypothetical protein
MTLELYGIGLCFVVVFASGARLRRNGRPYGTIPFTLHKLAALSAVVVLAVAVLQTSRMVDLGAAPLVAAVAGGVLFLATMASGGAMSIPNRTTPQTVALAHRLSSFVTTAACVALLWLLFASR